MHINLNATLLVQVIHFGIAYYLVRNFLLKPALAAWTKDQAAENKTLQLISHSQQKIEQTMYSQKQLWRSCNIYYQEQKPVVMTQQIVRDVAVNEPIIEMSALEKKSAVIAVNDLIEKTIGERL